MVDDAERPAFSITISPSADRQIEQISTWWRQHRSVSYLFEDELERALLRLVDNPWLGSRSQSSNLPDVRRLLIRRVDYVVFYRVRPRAHRIEVLAVWHARRGSRPLVRR